MSFYELEIEFLNRVADKYKTEKQHISKFAIESYIDIFKSYLLNNKKALELGCSSGYSTKLIYNLIKDLTVVDGSYKMIEKAKKTLGNKEIVFRCELFENMDENIKYDYVFANYIFEPIKEPEVLINKIYNILKNDGLCFITVPNAKALSRQMAKEMGLINDIYSLTENDINHGHRRVYDMELLINSFKSSRFEAVDKGGVFIKQFADFQLEKMIEQQIIGDEQLIAMRKIAKIYPEISGSIYIILKKI
ncbi:methyltransferase domain-containing protein [Clostridium sp. AL.422]|uniref:class I SAM-dependent methyltransferase n=1 Tax=Clostridium TaxID=1485 RepID=UPI00293DE05A|nr:MULTISPECIES: methyltransferase domain-containing protein [unclassified Clostridium]MDV4149711.1 methyltransferase domain-containing protein [Clostridium sp. AL.422]